MTFFSPTKGKIIMFVVFIIILEFFSYEISISWGDCFGESCAGPILIFHWGEFIILSIILILLSYLVASTIVYTIHKFKDK